MSLILYSLFPAMLMGYVALHFLLVFLPRRMKGSSLTQSREILKEAHEQQGAILFDKKTQFDAEIEVLQEELETQLLEMKETLAADEIALKERESLVDQAQREIEKRSEATEKMLLQSQIIATNFEEITGKLASSKELLIESLESKGKLAASVAIKQITSTLVDQRQLDSQKVLKLLSEEISANSKKMAQRALERSLSRYSPDFAWPKNTNIVEIEDETRLRRFAEGADTLFEELRQIAEIDIQVGGLEETRQSPIIKVAGGFGINREAARLTLMDFSKRESTAWKNVTPVWKSYLEKLEKEAMELGRRAVNDLRLNGIHPEIQRLIGALNWRTSYRQNQWYHTMEVAVLAGVLAGELGVDPDAAKRVGLLHDIGKAIDYRIDGSHAVISGDYADRFGESRIICDTVMSHHADLIVESPLAFVLRAADTLSGARPGARVNLEEGYQIRLSAISEAVRSFPGVNDLAIMNGGREVHIGVNYHRISDEQIKELTESIARKIENDVAFPGQIKVLLTRSFEAVTVA